MSLRLGDEAPNFTAETTEGTINFHEWLEQQVYYFRIPDYTPYGWELGYTAKLKDEFAKTEVLKVLALKWMI